MTLPFSAALAPYQPSFPLPFQPQTRNQTRIRSHFQTVNPACLITTRSRRSLLGSSAAILLYSVTGGDASAVKFAEIAGSGGVKALELRTGTGETPRDGDEVVRTHSISLCSFL
jgi:hypothetical protein